MAWNVAPECISIVILSIVWIYSRKSSLTPTLRNTLFQGCFLTSFCAMITNILSTAFIAQGARAPFFLTWIITMIYFIFTPLMGLVYSLYSASVIYEGRANLKSLMLLWSIPEICYFAIVLSNPFTKFIFDFNLQTGYSRGPFVALTYIVFYFYCLLCLFFAVKNKRSLDLRVYCILLIFPVIAVIVIIIQQFFPSIILSGSAATCALLIIYLHLQNRQISIDYITNLPNWLELSDMLDWLLRKGSQPFALIVVSLRDFKQVNDSFGQQGGDYLLNAIGQYLITLSREITVFRFKGDEFALLCNGDNVVNIEAYVQHILQRFSSAWEVREMNCKLSCAIGIVKYPEATYSLENIILSVEHAVINAKKEGLNSVCYFGEEMFNKLQRKKEIISILKEKVRKEDFEMYYQPIISLHNGKFEYAESLMRIPDSKLGPLFPGEFIPIAEETGLIIDITYIIIDKVCKFIHRIEANRLSLKCIHVNFSALQFCQADLTKKVLDIINKNGISPSCIKIEFTESAVAENTSQVTSFALEMEKNGIYMGLDDFGTGYSNLSTVITLPFKTIKLDKSLVWTALKQQRFATALYNLIRVFKELGMTVVAEGVETKEQSQFMIEKGVDQIQGFYYAKPMSGEEFEEFLKKA